MNCIIDQCYDCQSPVKFSTYTLPYVVPSPTIGLVYDLIDLFHFFYLLPFPFFPFLFLFFYLQHESLLYCYIYFIFIIFISTLFSTFFFLLKNRVGDDGVPAIMQYTSSDLYPMDRKETMAILQKDIHTPLEICK